MEGREEKRGETKTDNLMRALNPIRFPPFFLSLVQYTEQNEPHPLRHGRTLLLDDVRKARDTEKESVNGREAEREREKAMMVFSSSHLDLFLRPRQKKKKKKKKNPLQKKTGGPFSSSRSRTRWSGPCSKHSTLVVLVFCFCLLAERNTCSVNLLLKMTTVFVSLPCSGSPHSLSPPPFSFIFLYFFVRF